MATPGIWFLFHAVVATDHEWRPLRGRDCTHEYDASYEWVESVFASHNPRLRDPGAEPDQLENGVYSFQCHTELSRDPS